MCAGEAVTIRPQRQQMNLSSTRTRGSVSRLAAHLYVSSSLFVRLHPLSRIAGRRRGRARQARQGAGGGEGRRPGDSLPESRPRTLLPPPALARR